jgi:hypothetical protein
MLSPLGNMATSPGIARLPLQQGDAPRPLAAGQHHKFKTQPGKHYKVVERNADQERLADDVVVIRSGDDLQLVYADGTVLQLEDYFTACQKDSCELILPNGSASGLPLLGVTAEPNGSADGGSQIYEHHASDEIVALAPAVSVATAATGNIGAVLGGGAALAGAAAGGGGAGGASTAATAISTVPVVVARTTINGTMVAGPVIPGHGLTVELFTADGVTLLGKEKLSDTGQFSIDVGQYTGVIIAKLRDGDSGPDFWDEATEKPVDLVAQLREIGVCSAGTCQLNITPLTTLAALKTGALFEGASSSPIDATTVTRINAGVASAFGLTDLTGTAVVTTTDAVGTPSSAFTPSGLSAGQKYGAVLAALSGIDLTRDGDMQASIDWLADRLSVTGSQGTLRRDGLEALQAGAGLTSFSGGQVSLPTIVSSLMARSASSVSINSISTNDIIESTDLVTDLVTDLAQGLDITGSVAAGARITLLVGGQTRQATVNGTSWRYTLTDGDITALGQGPDQITATATLAGGTTESARRSILVDTLSPSINSIRVTSAEGLQARTLNAGDVVILSVSLSEPCFVMGRPQLALQIGAETVLADYASGSGSSTLTFRYDIAAGQSDGDGISVAVNSVHLDNAKIFNAYGSKAVLTHAPVPDNAAYLVDTAAPLFKGAYTVAENETTITVLAATDSSAVSYSLTNSDGQFMLSRDGRLSFVQPKDFEKPGGVGASNIYSLTVDMVDAAGNTARQQVDVSVTDVNEAPIALSLAAVTRHLAENASAASRTKVADLVVTDDALGSYTLTLQSADASRFEIEGNTLYFRAGITLDYETQAS